MVTYFFALPQQRNTAMPEGVMKAWLESSHLNGGNIVYIEELYESYLDNSAICFCRMARNLWKTS